jgi:hypothetical protein
LQTNYIESSTARPTSEMNTIEKTFYKEFPYQMMRSPHVKVVKDPSVSTSKKKQDFNRDLSLDFQRDFTSYIAPDRAPRLPPNLCDGPLEERSRTSTAAAVKNSSSSCHI